MYCSSARGLSKWCCHTTAEHGPQAYPVNINVFITLYLSKSLRDVWAKCQSFMFPACLIYVDSSAFNLLHICRPTVLCIYYILVTRGRQEDENPYLHVMVQCTKKIQTSNARFFDLTGTNDRIYHPNIEKLHSSTVSRQYIQKEGDFVEWGEFSSNGKSSSKNRD